MTSQTNENDALAVPDELAEFYERAASFVSQLHSQYWRDARDASPQGAEIWVHGQRLEVAENMRANEGQRLAWERHYEQLERQWLCPVCETYTGRSGYCKPCGSVAYVLLAQADAERVEKVRAFLTSERVAEAHLFGHERDTLALLVGGGE